MVGSALKRFTTPSDRIFLLEELAFLWAESVDGKHALQSAEAAMALGSQSVRTHYLRGRALALLGRLHEARREMGHVLTLDPDNADANRAVKMIDEAAGSRRPKASWRFWKR
jgi:Flp pilus assembly protein TadD